MNKMWMMGYNDGGEFSLGDSFNGRKLRPLIPRPAPTSTSPCNNNITGADIHCLSRIHGTHDLFALNHHLAVAEQSKRDYNAQQVVVSSRWNPTPEQLQTLEELYRRGTRTPNADEIQQITAQLRRYGKIEGKNVFYWFQNHKARERQKRRRQLETVPERTDSGGVNRTGYAVEQTKNWGNPTNCTSTFSEKSVSIEGGKAECRAAEVGWIHFEEGDQQHTLISNIAERNATWHMMNFSCSSSSSSSSSSTDPTTNLLNTTTYKNNNLSPSPPTTTTTNTASVLTSSTTSPSTVRSSFTTMDVPYSKLFLKPEDLARYVSTVGGNNHHHHKGEESQTLELFPLRSSGTDGNQGVKEAEIDFPATNSNNNHIGRPAHQFFEFLPLKN